MANGINKIERQEISPEKAGVGGSIPSLATIPQQLTVHRPSGLSAIVSKTSSGPCDTCAFRQGCATYDQEPHNRLKAMIAARAGIPFFCHHGFDWQGAEIFLIAGRHISIRGELMENMHVCAGWKREVAELAKKGWFPKSPEERKTQFLIGQAALHHMRRFIDAKESQEKDEAHRELQCCVEMLFKGGCDAMD